jgi:hypothetical protein
MQLQFKPMSCHQYMKYGVRSGIGSTDWIGTQVMDNHGRF